MGLKKKKFLALLVPTVVVLICLSFYSYSAAKKAINIHIDNASAYVTAYYAEKMQTILVRKELAAEELAANYGARTTRDWSREEIIELLDIRNKDGIINVCVGFETKEFYSLDGWIPPADYDPRTRDWYVKGKAADGVYYTEVYQDAISKQLVASICRRIIGPDGQIQGVVIIDLDLAPYSEIAKAIQAGKTGYGFLLDSAGNHLYHPSMTLEDNIFKIQNGAFASAGTEFLSGKTSTTSFTFNGEEKYYTSSPVGRTGWALVIGTPYQEIYEDVNVIGKVSLIVTVLAILILGAIILRTTLSIVGPIQELAALSDKMAHGDLTVETSKLLQDVPKNEIGALVESFHDMKTQTLQVIQNVTQVIAQVHATAQEMTNNINDSVHASENAAQAVSDVAMSAKQQLDTVIGTSKIVEQMISGLRQTTADVNSVSEQSNRAAQTAKSGSSTVEKAIGQMANIEQTVNISAQVVTTLGERSKEIDQIVGVIAGIAGQTNLLALNAAIEAARAGEGGRGFAVVAEEVRKLAEQSETAAKQISGLINEIQQDTSKAVVAMNNGMHEVGIGAEMVNTAGQAFHEIVGLVTQVSGQVSQISGTMQEISGSSQNVIFSVNEITKLSEKAASHTQTVSATTQEQSASINEIAGASEALARMAQDLQDCINEFKIY